MYYRSKITNAIMNHPYQLDYIYGRGIIDVLIDTGLLEEVPEPTVEECIRNGGKLIGVIRYREIHGCKLAEAKEAVEAIIQSGIVPENEHEPKSMMVTSMNHSLNLDTSKPEEKSCTITIELKEI